MQKWRDPPPCPKLEAGEVHVWRASLELSARELSRLRFTLSADERGRADRFYFEKDRAQFTAAHGILRDILGRYRDVAPGDLRFGEGSHGKPGLILGDEETSKGDAASTRVPVEFNMSHSNWMALYAFSLDARIGVDIEWIREDFDWEGIAGRFFHPDETAALLRLPESGRRGGFFTYWTYKEAYIKGVGEGLSIPTKSFIVKRSPDGSAVVERLEPDTGYNECWHLHELHPAPGYAGAVAIERENARIVRWEYGSTP